MQGINAGQSCQHPVTEPGLTDEGDVFGTVAHVESAEKILVVDRESDCPLPFGLHVLDVGLDERMHVTHLRDEEVFALDDAVNDIVERKGSRSGVGWASGRRLDGVGRGTVLVSDPGEVA